MPKAITWIFRHRLNFQSENTQIIQSPTDAFRHHTQIFSTDKHARCINHCRKFPHGLTIPEMIMTMIIVVNVDTVESLAFGSTQHLIDKIFLDSNTRMVHLRMITVGYKQHITDQSIKSFTECFCIISIIMLLKIALNLTLCVKLRLQLIPIVTFRIEEFFLYQRFQLGKIMIQNVFRYIRFSKRINPEMKSGSLYFLNAQG